MLRSSGESKGRKMLLNIHVKNMALIQEAEIDLGQGLNILTGETGAGKSIIIGAVNVALGAQSFKGFARDGADQALSELVFSVEDDKCRQRLKDLGVALEEDLVIISRKLTGGRSISKVNGETVPVSRIRQIAEVLIDIHGQHEHQSLLYRKNHLGILDEFAKEELTPLKEISNQLYKEYKKLEKELEQSAMDETARAKEADFLRFEIQEIGAAGLSTGEDEELERSYRRMANARKIIESAGEAYGYTGYDNAGAGELTGRALRSLSGAAAYDEALEGLTEQLADIDSLLNDFNRELADYMAGLTFDDGEFASLEERLDLINRLKAKYGNCIEEILAYKQEKEERLTVLDDYEAYKQRLEAAFKTSREALFSNAKEMSKIRHRYAQDLQKRIKEALEDLNFLNVEFEIGFERLKEPGPEGYDEICFQISTNPGEAVKPLNEIASGGELSRIMLAIKTVMADRDATGTLIFDEIDVGISGRTAQKVSEKMAVIAGNHQVICITHLAQIAAMADCHFVIEKKFENQMTITSIRKLDGAQSVEELARILGGVEITDTVRRNAEEMKEMALRTKKY